MINVKLVIFYLFSEINGLMWDVSLVSQKIIYPDFISIEYSFYVRRAISDFSHMTFTIRITFEGAWTCFFIVPKTCGQKNCSLSFICRVLNFGVNIMVSSKS